MGSLLSFLSDMIDLLAPTVPTIITDLENLVAAKKAQYQPIAPVIQQQDAAELAKLEQK